MSARAGSCRLSNVTKPSTAPPSLLPHSPMHICFVVALAWLGVAAGCDTPTLPAGATLNISFEASALQPAPPPTPLPTDKQSCIEDGAAVVDLRAWTPDGKPADAVQVTLWMDPALGAQLLALSKDCA